MKRNVVIFGNSKLCEPCKQLKHWLEYHQIEHTYKDLGSDNKIDRIEWKKEAHALGLKSIPTIFVDDIIVLVGFDEKKLEEILL